MKKLKKIIKDYMITRKSPWTEDCKQRLKGILYVISIFVLVGLLDLVGFSTLAEIVGIVLFSLPFAILLILFIAGVVDYKLYDHYKKVIEKEQRRQK